jgi:hypothetical protein
MRGSKHGIEVEPSKKQPLKDKSSNLDSEKQLVISLLPDFE